MATSVSDPLTGRLLDGRYEVGRLLARGGMAAVYEAVDRRLGRPVAVKVMHPAFAADAEFVARFIREARSAARLSHANVVAVYDQGSDGDVVFLAMEYVPGGTLRDLLRHRGRLAPADALPLYEQMLAALSAAHRAGLVHRDVKPENVLITQDGRVKVADFGLARAVTSATNAATTGVIIGTVSYLSPEQVERSVADARSDVYSAGIVLYEMLTGEKPYRGATPMEVAYQHVHSRVPPPSRLVPDLPVELDTIVARATARDPDLRPHDAGELLAEIARAREGRPLLLPPLADDAEPTVVRRDEPHGDTLVVPRPSQPYGQPPAPPHGPLSYGQPPPVQPLPGQPLPAQHLAGQPAYDQSAYAARQDRPGQSPAPSGRVGAAPGDGRVDVLPPEARKRRRRGWIIFLVVLALGVGVAVGAYWFAEGRFTEAPAVVGLAQDEAIAELERWGLTPEVVPETEPSETVPVAHVVRTDPEPGARIVTGTEVLLYLSGGPERFTLPDVAGSTPADAVDLLESAEMPLDVAARQLQEYSETIAEGDVIRTEPASGTKMKRGQAVTLVVSLGREPLDVPDVAGTPLEEATAALEAAGFQVTSEEVFSADVEAGLVVAQDKTGELFRDDTVHLQVSKGPVLVEVPDVVDRSQGEAVQLLVDAGFEVDVNFPLGAAFIDRVVGQSEDAGSLVPEGSTITLQIV